MKKSIFLLSLCLVFISLLTFPKSVSASTTFFSDEFTEVDGTSLIAHNSSWTIEEGTAVINNNTLIATNATLTPPSVPNYAQNACSSVDILFPNEGITLTLRKRGPEVYGNGNFQVVYSSLNPSNNSISMGFIKPLGLNPSLNLIRFSDTLDSWPANGWHSFKFCGIGTRFTSYIDNNFIGGFNDSEVYYSEEVNEYEKYSYNIQTEGTAYIDNFKYEVFELAVTVSQNPVPINTPVTITANFEDPETTMTHMAFCPWLEYYNPACLLTESNGSGVASGTRTYAQPGVYVPTIVLYDQTGAPLSLEGYRPLLYKYLAVYDPDSHGNFSGARLFTSPVGAYTQDQSLTGQVQFAVSARNPGQSPEGRVSMGFKAANLLFESTSFSSLVVANNKGTLRGTGTINDLGNYTFLVTGLDGTGGNGKIRFQIKDQAGNVLYDTQPGVSDIANPTTPVTGAVIVH